jgi:acetyltransferase-like isoleucine patch superfamily enzyme
MNCTIRDQQTIGEDSLIGIGAVALKPVAADTTVLGNPARIIERKEDR